NTNARAPTADIPHTEASIRCAPTPQAPAWRESPTASTTEGETTKEGARAHIRTKEDKVYRRLPESASLAGAMGSGSCWPPLSDGWDDSGFCVRVGVRGRAYRPCSDIQHDLAEALPRFARSEEHTSELQ